MRLKKRISFFGVFSIATGTMISSGIFILPSILFASVGSDLFIAYFLAGILGGLGITSIIELSTAMPKAGGDYFFINKTFGPLLGTISGLLGWLAISLKSAFAIFGLSQIIYIYTNMHPLLISAIFTFLFITINAIGVQEATSVQILLVTILLAIIIFYLIIGIPNIQTHYFQNMFDSDMRSILFASGLAFISFGGLLKATNMSEEIIHPKKNIPLGIFTSIAVVTLLYTAIIIVLTGILPPEVFSKSLTPVADSAKILMGNNGFILISIASSLAFLTTANAGLMAASRYPLALSNDKLIPSVFSRVNTRFKTPTIAIIITGIIIYAAQLLPIETLVKVASTIVLTSYVLANIALIILRESKITNYKPSFTAPFYPFLQLFCIATFTFFIIELGKESLKLSLVFFILSVCIYMFYGRKIQHKEFALLYVLKKIIDKRLMKNTLEDELRDIIFHRDDVKQDYADHLIKNSEIIDMDYAISFTNVLKIITKKLEKHIGTHHETLTQLFLKRQAESSTVLNDSIAIPHIIIKGKRKMFLYIMRNKEGVQFSDTEKHIKAVFFIGGTQDLREVHLQVLSAIAKIVGDDTFHKRWITAKNTVEIKNLLLESERKR